MASNVYRIEDSTALLYSTCRIIARGKDGDESYGSGFFFSFPAGDGLGLQTLVTNKHVVAGAVEYDLYFHEAIEEAGKPLRPSGKIHGIRVQAVDQGWFGHPSEDVDLCAMPLEPLRAEAARLGKRIFLTTLSTAHIPSDEDLGNLLALEPITMIGYPVGLWDHVNNFPIARRGMTATHPRVDFNGQAIGVADIAAYPGSSGSPILIANEGYYAVPDGRLVEGTRILLLGILFAGPQFSADGSITMEEIPTKRVPVVNMNIPVHLGYYIKARRLLELGDVLFQVNARGVV